MPLNMKSKPETVNPHPFWLPADWPAPAQIQAGTTTRHAGISAEPYEHFNLATHVGDSQDAVLHNRALLKTQLALPNEPVWLRQTHSARIVKARDYAQGRTHRRLCANADMQPARDGNCRPPRGLARFLCRYNSPCVGKISCQTGRITDLDRAPYCGQKL